MKITVKRSRIGRCLYVDYIPTSVAPGLVLVHNHIVPAERQRPGANGFRAWLATPDPRYVECPCSWADHLGAHYRVDRGARP